MMEKNETSLKKFILIILFSIIFSYVVQDAIRLVIFKFLEISDGSFGLAQWGDTFFLRILASIIGTTTGAIVIGTFLGHKAKLAAIIAAIPTTLFWIAILYFGINIMSEQESSFENIKMMLILPSSLIILSPAVAFWGAKIGIDLTDNFERENSILNIKWFHWLWILPLYLSKVVAVPLFSLILLWKIDFLYDKSGAYPSFIDLISNWSYYITRIIILVIFIGLLTSVSHAYSLLSKKTEINKVKKGAIILGHVMLFSVIHALLFYEFM